MDFLKDIEVGYSLVVGIVNGISKEKKQPYEIYNLVTKVSDKDNNCKVEQVFNFDLDSKQCAKFPIKLGDKVMFLYVGNGNYKKIIDVLHQSVK